MTPFEILSSHISHCVVVCYDLKFVKFRGFVLVFFGLYHTNSQYSGYQFLVYIHVTACKSESIGDISFILIFLELFKTNDE